MAYSFHASAAAALRAPAPPARQAIDLPGKPGLVDQVRANRRTIDVLIVASAIAALAWFVGRLLA